MLIINENELFAYIQEKLFLNDKFQLQTEWIEKVVGYEMDYLVEKGYYEVVEDYKFDRVGNCINCKDDVFLNSAGICFDCIRELEG